MKPQKRELATRFPDPTGRYTNIMVLKNNNGYYIGTQFICGPRSKTPSQIQPGSRESEEYFLTRAMAQTALVTGNWTQRVQP